MREIWYHGSNKTDDILSQGFRIIEDDKFRTDPGDFGLGIYFTKNIRVALNYGGNLFKCEIIMDEVANIFNPYRLFEQPQPDKASQLFRRLAFELEGGPVYDKNGEFVYDEGPGRMKTVTHSRKERMEVTTRIRDYFLNQDYTGIVARDGSQIPGQELVVFDPSIIRNCELFFISDQAYDRIKESDEDSPSL